MGEPEKVDFKSRHAKLLEERNGNVNREINNKNNNKPLDNVIDNKYALKDSHISKSYSDHTAVEICQGLGDQQNFAYYRKIVFQIGPDKARQIFEKTKVIIKMALKNKDPILNPGALFASLCKSFIERSA